MKRYYDSGKTPSGKELAEARDERLTEADRLKRHHAYGTTYHRGTVDALRESPLPETHRINVTNPWKGTNEYYLRNNPYSRTNRSLTTRQMTGCERLTLMFLSDHDPNAKLGYQPPIIGGRLQR